MTHPSGLPGQAYEGLVRGAEVSPYKPVHKCETPHGTVFVSEAYLSDEHEHPGMPWSVLWACRKLFRFIRYSRWTSQEFRIADAMNNAMQESRKGQPGG